MQFQRFYKASKTYILSVGVLVNSLFIKYVHEGLNQQETFDRC